MNFTQHDIDRFFLKVTKLPNGCWLYTGYTDNGGYGRFWLQNGNVKVHRFSYELHNGRIPEGKEVMHACDRRECCNPAHLRAGTHEENMYDMKIKGRANPVCGEDKKNAKLTEEQVIQIRNSFLAQRQLSKIYGVSPCQISKIRTGKEWKHLPYQQRFSFAESRAA
jgi:ribosome-associated protein YbcJ (S4-like RNA binding protein)